MGGVVGGVLGGVGGGALGYFTGKAGKKETQDNTSGKILSDPTGLENNATARISNNYDNIVGMVGAGPSQGDYTKGIQSQRDLAGLLQQYQQNGGMPTQDDITQSNSISKNLYGARQVALDQSFTDQNTQAQRLSAQLGRSADDPILQARLRTGFMKQQDSLNAEQQATSQSLSLALPGQRLGYATQASAVLSGLGDQALQNQNYLLGLGSNLQASERNWRLQTATNYNNMKNQQGGGTLDGIVGAINGAQSGAMSGFAAGSGASGGSFGSLGGAGASGGSAGGLGGSSGFASSLQSLMSIFGSGNSGGQAAGPQIAAPQNGGYSMPYTTQIQASNPYAGPSAFSSQFTSPFGGR